jgi:hypothetical protein
MIRPRKPSTRLLDTGLALPLCLALALPATSAAGPRDKPPAKSEAEPEAEILARQAVERFKAADLEVAARLFMQAYKLAKRPVLVFNAARAYEEAGKKGDAVALFRLYMEISDDVSGIDDARKRIAKLEEEPAAVAVPVAVTAVADDGGGVRWGFLAGGVGVGLGLGATGGWLWLDAGERETALAKKLKLKGPDGKVTGISESEAKAENDAIGMRKTMAAISGGIGLAALGVGLWLGLTGSSGSQTARVELMPSGLMVQARF